MGRVAARLSAAKQRADSRKTGQRSGAVPAPNPSDASLGFAQALACFHFLPVIPGTTRDPAFRGDIGARGEMSACDPMVAISRPACERTLRIIPDSPIDLLELSAYTGAASELGTVHMVMLAEPGQKS